MTWQYHLIWLKIGNKTFFPINNSNDTKLVIFIIVRWYQNSKHYWSFLFPRGSGCKNNNIPVSNDRHCVTRWFIFFCDSFRFCVCSLLYIEKKKCGRYLITSLCSFWLLDLTHVSLCPNPAQVTSGGPLSIFKESVLMLKLKNIDFKSDRKNSGVNEC